MLYETKLPHLLDIQQLEYAIKGRYAYEILRNGLRIFRKSNNDLKYYFTVHGDGKITVEAKSIRSARRRIYGIIDWLKENGFIILLEDNPSRFYFRRPSKLLSGIKIKPTKA